MTKKIFFCKTLVLIVFACFAATFSSCNSDDDEPIVRVQAENTKSTFIMYFQGNNSLKSFLVENANRTLQGMTTDFPVDARVFLYLDFKVRFNPDDKEGRSGLFELIPPSRKSESAIATHIKDYGEQDSTDPQFMRSVLNDVKELSPCEEYGIVMSSHGVGWFPVGAGVQSQKIIAGSGISGGGMEHNFNKPEEAEYVTRFYGQYGSSWMDISDVVDGLSAIDFDYVIFDACFMSSAEVLYDLRNSAKFVVASPAEVMGYGFPFDRFVPKLFGNSPLKDRLADVAKTFYEYYSREEEGAIPSATIAVVDTSKLEKLAESVKGVFDGGVTPPDINSIQGLESMQYHAFHDLKHYLQNIYTDQQAYDAFEAALKDAIVYEGHTKNVYSAYSGWFTASNVCGISSYIPRDEYPVNKGYYYETAWAKATQPDGYPF